MCFLVLAKCGNGVGVGLVGGGVVMVVIVVVAVVGGGAAWWGCGGWYFKIPWRHQQQQEQEQQQQPQSRRSGRHVFNAPSAENGDLAVQCLVMCEGYETSLSSLSSLHCC